jgi:hypothetical protein
MSVYPCDEWGPVLFNNFKHSGHSAGKNEGHDFALQIATDQNESSNFCIDQGASLDFIDPYALVFGDEYPGSPTNFRQPFDIFGTVFKVRGVLFDACLTSIGNCLCYSLSRQISVSEEDEFRLAFIFYGSAGASTGGKALSYRIASSILSRSM